MARTTLIIPDALWRDIKLRAAKENRTISDWVADAFRMKIQAANKAAPPTRLKFDDFWVTKDAGEFRIPLTREGIYDLPD